MTIALILALITSAAAPSNAELVRRAYWSELESSCAADPAERNHECEELAR